jgi:hypothetical protein
MLLTVAHPKRHLFAVFAGALFSLLVWKIAGMQFRYALAVIGGLLFLCVAMIGIHSLMDVLIYAFAFNIPFSMFGKWLFPIREVYAARGISVGMVELLLVLAYGVWFAQIFITRREGLPRFTTIDFFFLVFVLTQVISSIGATDKRFASYDIIYTIKHFLIYFFVAAKVKRRHLRWIVVLFLFAIMFESTLALYERMSGNVGIGLTKGNVQMEGFSKQPGVPGIEQIRAAGTTNDSHTLGLYFSLLLPVPFVLGTMHFLGVKRRLILSMILIAGTLGLIVTFSRSGWLSFGIAAVFALGIITLRWKEGQAVIIVIAVIAVISLLYPKGYEYLFIRLCRAPYKILVSRFDQIRTGLGVWRQHPLFGVGPNNYRNALEGPNVLIIGGGEHLLHNMFMYVATETGLFGIIGFFGIAISGIVKCWKLLRADDLLVRGLALAIMTAFIGYLLDGLTDPMFKEAVTYAQYTMYLGLCVALGRIASEQQAQSPRGRLAAES